MSVLDINALAKSLALWCKHTHIHTHTPKQALKPCPTALVLHSPLFSHLLLCLNPHMCEWRNKWGVYGSGIWHKQVWEWDTWKRRVQSVWGRGGESSTSLGSRSVSWSVCLSGAVNSKHFHDVPLRDVTAVIPHRHIGFLGLQSFSDEKSPCTHPGAQLNKSMHSSAASDKSNQMYYW